jgi:hypothetical protein
LEAGGGPFDAHLDVRDVERESGPVDRLDAQLREPHRGGARTTRRAALRVRPQAVVDVVERRFDARELTADRGESRPESSLALRLTGENLGAQGK